MKVVGLSDVHSALLAYVAVMGRCSFV